jgi:hypothetical protein
MRKYSIADAHTIAKAKGGQCLSTQLDMVNCMSKLNWLCKQGHKWIAAFDQVRRLSWCPACSRGVNRSIKDLQCIAASFGGQCLSEKFDTMHTKVLWACHCGHQWYASTANILYHKQWCPECGQRKANKQTKHTAIHWKTQQVLKCASIWEMFTVEYLNEHKINYEWQPAHIITPFGKYYPDALLSNGVYLEVKGRWLRKAKEKIDWCLQNNIFIEVWDYKALKNLGIIKKIRRYYKYRDIFTKCESITIHGERND